MQSRNIFGILQSSHLQPKLLLLLGICLLYFFSYFQRVAVPGTCFDELQRDFNTTAYAGVALITNLAGVVMDCFKEQACFTDQGIIYPLIAYRLIFSGCAVLAVVSVAAACFIRETKGAYLPQS